MSRSSPTSQTLTPSSTGFRLLRKTVQIVYTLYAFVLFVLIILMLAPFVILFLPFGRIRGGNIMYDFFRVMGYLWLLMIGIRHKTSYRPSLDPTQQYIFIANHISYIDAVTIICSIKHHFRPIGKHELLKIPVFGFIYKRCVVTVNRSSAEDRARSLDDLRKILAKGISILVFPEGTFNMGNMPMAECYDGAFKLAVETGKQIQPIVFPDALDRLHYQSFFTLTPGLSRAIYLDPINPLDFPDLDHKGLKAIAVEKMSRHLIAAKASWIGDDYLNPETAQHQSVTGDPAFLQHQGVSEDLASAQHQSVTVDPASWQLDGEHVQPDQDTRNVLSKNPKSN
jgi:1-acyl-sn-glycerol-3-phosphate acyltransferase